MANRSFSTVIAAVAVALLIVLPAGEAATRVGLGAPPVKIFTEPDSVNAQKITGFALDAQGRFAAAVVDVESTGLLGVSGDPCRSENEGNCDLYSYDLTVQKSVLSAGKHGNEYRSPGAQVVAAAQNTPTLGAFAAGGPGRTVSKWTTQDARPTWETNAQGGLNTQVVAVAVSPNGQNVYSGQNTASKGYVQRFYESDGVQSDWSYDATFSFDENENPKVRTLALSGDGRRLLAGTTEGVLIFQIPADSGNMENPTTDHVARGALGLEVVAIAVSHDGRYAAVGANDGSTGYVYFFDLNQCAAGKDCAIGTYFSKSAGGAVNAVAITKSGDLFAVGSTDSRNGKVQVYERTDNGVLALYETPATLDSGVKSLSFSQDGGLLVAASAATVYGFHTSRTEPLWELSAGDAGLDVPLVGAAVAGSGERIFVAGATKVQAFRQQYSVSTSLAPEKVAAANPGDAKKVVLSVTNTGSAPDTYDVKITRPAGWGDSSRDESPKLVLPGEMETFNVTVEPPDNAPAGSRDVLLEVRSSALQKKITDNAPDKPSTAVLKSLKLNYTVVAVRDNIRMEADDTEESLDQEQERVLHFTVRNLGNSEAHVNYTVTQDNPRGTTWAVSLRDEQQLVQPGGEVANQLRVTAPAEAANGERNDVTVTAKVGGRTLNSLKFTLLVNPSYGLSLEAEDETSGTLTVNPGSPSTIKLLVRNTGNTPDDVDLTAQVDPDAARLQWRAILDRNSLQVGAGHTRTVTLTLRTTESDPLPATVTVTARSRGDGGDDTITFHVEVPAAETKSGPFNVPAPSPGIYVLALAGAGLLARAGRRKSGGSP